MSRLEKYRELRRKNRNKALVALSLILVGLGCAAYPSWLWLDGQLEQRRLDRAFNPVIEVPADEGYWQTDPNANEGERPLPQWTDFPPTKIIIPALGVNVNVVAVEDMSVLSRRLNHPPSYYPTSSFPGETGNVTIAGHRDGPAGYFLRVNKLKPGDTIILATPEISYQYEVERVFVTEPTDFSVVAPTDYPALTITTCQRVGADSAAKRLIVRCRLKGTL
ncbi:MAG: sortase [Firmicutes bacterium]|nr:sortase [Bacillota bacterium]